MFGRQGRKRLGFAVAGTAITAAVAVPTWVAAAGDAPARGTDTTVAQEAGPVEGAFFIDVVEGPFGRAEFAATGGEGFGFHVAGFGPLDLAEDGEFGRFPRLHRWGVPFLVPEVLEEFDIDREELRAALETVAEQFPPEDRPEFSIPPTDEERAAIEAYRAQRLAALAGALGIPADEFQAAIDAAEEERRVAFEDRRAAMEERRNAYRAALADALGVTVEELEAAIQEAREAVGDEEMRAVPTLRTEPLF